ncbi:MAG: ATP-dependent DNA helicase RecG [Chloroflexi bacterium RBG_19FT_COMBO_49_13]|nr:MAG: ATP-dependent DNA helicase RecG [Chloroflexi bacterium RBG_19FT_COMBO_49_13]
MRPSLQKLKKYILLEAQQNYGNRAVIGGFERMVEPWLAEAQADALTADLIKSVISSLRDYASLPSISRYDTLNGLWKHLQRETEETFPSLPLPVDNPTKSSEDKEKSPSSSQPRGNNYSHPAGQPSEHKVNPEKPTTQPAALSAPTTVLPGVGPKHAQTLARLGLHTLGDMLYNFPRRYDDYTQLKPIQRLQYGEEVTVIGTIDSISSHPTRGGRHHITEAIITDGTGFLRVTWFNQPWIGKRLLQDTQIVLSGKIDQYLGRLIMNSPEWEPLETQNLHTNRIVPVYPLTSNITQRWLRRLMYEVVSYWAARVAEPLPESLRHSAQVLDLPTALLQVHFPSSSDRLIAARYRLAFDEILMLQLGVLSQKRNWQNRSASVYETPDDWLESQVAHLPFPLTSAQSNALKDVKADLASGHPMNRLLQGDVGSGKTVIAAMGVAMLAHHQAQSALLAPTSILAEQHYKSMLSLLAWDGNDTSEIPLETPAPLKPDQIRLLLGATAESEKQEIRNGLASGSIKLVIGTHALLEEPVSFKNLQLAVIDEQHRFGVDQRALLRSKGENPHLLVMTATPIPRSLALTVYGDLDLSVMDEMPPGRQPIQTQVFYPRERERAYVFVRNQIDLGHQCFIIYPLVEESETIDSLAAVEEHVRLQKEVFPEFTVGLLHGRMKLDEKDAVMADFCDGAIQILVSTSVVEVGVDVPNATVMLIEGANRFGLSQLHQFRGRVGRSQYQSYCILIPDTPDAAENERLAAMVETNDGFVLAQRDLEQRGPGEFLGTRQSGYSALRMANLTDIHLIEKARQHAKAIFDIDPDLKSPDHQLLAGSLKRFWSIGQGDIS